MYGDLSHSIEDWGILPVGGLPLLRTRQSWGGGNLFSVTFLLSVTQLNFCTYMIHNIFLSGKVRRVSVLASVLKVQLTMDSMCDGISVLKHFASFPWKVAQDGFKRMRRFYRPWLQGKKQCHRRPIIPFRIIFPILLSCCWQLLFICSQMNSTSRPAAGSVFGHQEVLCPAFLLERWKNWELTLLLSSFLPFLTQH